jgi:2,4-diaminopentanoate dehydrogenase
VSRPCLTPAARAISRALAASNPLVENAFEIRFASDLAPATQTINTPGGTIEPGTIGGVRLRWEGISNGRSVLENYQVWIAGGTVDGVDDWGAESRHGYLVDIAGNPNVSNVFLPTPASDPRKMTLSDHHAFGMRITGMPLINAVRGVCAAAPGIRTYKDLPPVVASGRILTGRSE